MDCRKSDWWLAVSAKSKFKSKKSKLSPVWLDFEFLILTFEFSQPQTANRQPPTANHPQTSTLYYRETSKKIIYYFLASPGGSCSFFHRAIRPTVISNRL